MVTVVSILTMFFTILVLGVILMFKLFDGDDD